MGELPSGGSGSAEFSARCAIMVKKPADPGKQAGEKSPECFRAFPAAACHQLFKLRCGHQSVSVGHDNDPLWLPDTSGSGISVALNVDLIAFRDKRVNLVFQLKYFCLKCLIVYHP